MIWITLALAAAAAGLTLRGFSPSLSPSGATHVPVGFDLLFGIAGAGGMLWIAVRLWRFHRRDWAAAGLALMGWAGLAAAVTVRSALFAQADYERGRLPFFAIGVAVLAILSALAYNRRGSP